MECVFDFILSAAELENVKKVSDSVWLLHVYPRVNILMYIKEKVSNIMNLRVNMEI